MAYIYLSYPWGLIKRPKWIDRFLEASGVEFYDPSIRLTDQVGRISIPVEGKAIPEFLIKAYGFSQDMLLGPSQVILDWEKGGINEQVWRDLYFVARSSVILVDCSLPNYSDMALELSFAYVLNIPIVLISNLPHIPTQLQYISDTIMKPDHPRLVSIVKSLMK